MDRKHKVKLRFVMMLALISLCASSSDAAHPVLLRAGSSSTAVREWATPVGAAEPPRRARRAVVCLSISSERSKLTIVLLLRYRQHQATCPEKIVCGHPYLTIPYHSCMHAVTKGISVKMTPFSV
eukprot:2431336-Pleurochrysis_carterae.AAC.4